MFIVFFALWVLLNGRWTTEIGVFGVVLAAVLYAFVCAFFGWRPKKDLALLRRLGQLCRYGALLIKEIVSANVAVMRRILSPGAEVEPQLVRFTTPLKSEAARVALADSITLTPGTITCSLENGEYVVHCLDKEMMSGLTDGAFVQALCAMEQKEKKEDRA